jgi:2-succinyl-6-hydroxy-2,4-cyclohexadiene-1-carboxylate synthase
MEIATIDGIEIAYALCGKESGHPILLLHGYTGSHRDWNATVTALTEAGWRTLCPDHAGHGQSAAPDDVGEYRMERLAALYMQLCEGLDFAPAVVAGQGMGAAIAEEYAIACPAMVRALVLVASAGGGATGIGNEPIAAHIDELRAVFEDGGMEAVFDRLVEMGLRPDAGNVDDARYQQLRQELAKVSWPGYEFAGLALRTRRSTLPGLGHWTRPTLIVHGIDASEPIRRIADDLQAAMPHARRDIVAGAAQSPQREAPEAFNRLMLDFLSSI